MPFRRARSAFVQYLRIAKGESMSEFTVFYSWQSDLPRKRTRDVIHNASKMAVDRIGASIEDSPRFDHDTLDIPGAPEIAQTIFKKIDRAGLFIADVSFVGATTGNDSNKIFKLLPNPNVLLELGYAAAKIGWDRIILVTNTLFGLPEKLPFDLVHRRFPIRFKLGPEDKSSIDEIESELSNEIEAAIKVSLAAEHEAVRGAVELLDVHGLRWMHEYGKADYFYSPDRKTYGEVVANFRPDLALVRLIDQRLLRTELADQGTVYAYHWTYLGKLVLHHIGIR